MSARYERERGMVSLSLFFLFMFVFSSVVLMSVIKETKRAEYRRYAVTRERIKRVSSALNLYFLKQTGAAPYIVRGRFPDTLGALVAEGLVSEDDLKDGWGRPLVYHVWYNPPPGSCVVDLTDAPAAVVVSSGKDKVLQSTFPHNFNDFTLEGDDVGVRVTSNSAIQAIMNEFRQRLELWAQAAANYWEQQWFSRCINTDTPDTDHCCNPNRTSPCSGPKYFFPPNLRSIAELAYGSQADVVKIIDLLGYQVSYAVKDSFSVSFITRCPNREYVFTIPEKVWKYWR